jgi:hypothetical protein
MKRICAREQRISRCVSLDVFCASKTAEAQVVGKELLRSGVHSRALPFSRHEPKATCLPASLNVETYSGKLNQEDKDKSYISRLRHA